MKPQVGNGGVHKFSPVITARYRLLQTLKNKVMGNFGACTIDGFDIP